MKLRFLSIVLFVFGFTLCLQAGDKYYVKMADSEMKRNPESWMLDFFFCSKVELLSWTDVAGNTSDMGENSRSTLLRLCL